MINNSRKPMLVFLVVLIAIASSIFLLNYLTRAVPYYGDDKFPHMEQKMIEFENTTYLILFVENEDWARTFSSARTRATNNELHILFFRRNNTLPSLILGQDKTHFTNDWNEMFTFKIANETTQVTYGVSHKVIWTREDGLSSNK